MVNYGDISLPVGYEIIKKDILYSDLETKKVRRKSNTTKNQLFKKLIQQACNNKIKFDYILADNWFGSKDGMEL